MPFDYLIHLIIKMKKPEIEVITISDDLAKKLYEVTLKWFNVQRGCMSAQGPSGKAVEEVLENIAKIIR